MPSAEIYILHAKRYVMGISIIGKGVCQKSKTEYQT